MEVAIERFQCCSSCVYFGLFRDRVDRLDFQCNNCLLAEDYRGKVATLIKQVANLHKLLGNPCSPSFSSCLPQMPLWPRKHCPLATGDSLVQHNLFIINVSPPIISSLCKCCACYMSFPISMLKVCC